MNQERDTDASAAKQRWLTVEEQQIIAAGWPWPIAKASVDPFDYALGLDTGEVVLFGSCSIGGEWVTVYPDPRATGPDPRDEGGFGPDWPHPPCPRGLVIHRSRIAWCTDAPYGS